MAYNFKNCDWDQLFLFPPDIRDWLPQDHLVWFITEIVSQLDLSPFYSRYNPEGDGCPAYHPAMMTALYFYSYCSGERSSRRIERLCMESVPYRVVSGGLQPDHTTISRFRKKFASELSSLFLQIITLCRKAGLCILNTVSLDGTKIGANASLSANRNEAGLRKEIRTTSVRRRKRTPGKTSCTVPAGEGMNCLRTCPPRRGGFASCGRSRRAFGRKKRRKSGSRRRR